MAEPNAAGSKLLFTIPGKQHGAGSVHVTWRRDGQYVASCGINRLFEMLHCSLATRSQVLNVQWLLIKSTNFADVHLLFRASVLIVSFLIRIYNILNAETSTFTIVTVK